MTKDTTQTDFKDVTRGGQAAVNNFLFAQTWRNERNLDKNLGTYISLM